MDKQLVCFESETRTMKICLRRIISRSKVPSYLSLRHFSQKWDVVRNAEVRRFARDCMTSVGTKPDHAESLAEVLVQADYRGHYSHGLNRLGE
jgi:hypothetical protein